ncbi:N-acetyltransferase [Alicyclobacillus cycloheptanicus]|uniref:Amino-acid N-acetyltransferase n=1 Tax=Alicyclobacillus cycloheptanicus TaxID=1457 RepID=A0ABT9XH85_9BACL|nr:N-acetyltransferase [Alicyclobacillus cycloheptanicus]MDQ0189557.1 amino-acid N-acetyltransferase [Alicyclobacillus cycloheptanicus]WDM01610.1 N-acetyltransferase [Alicyclobacillus cycloheptanicus]
MQIRQATVKDVPEMQQLIQHYADMGLMLPRSAKSLYENLQCFVVGTSEGRIVGTAGLHILWQDLAEIRSLAVHPETQGQGLGRRIVQHLLGTAAALGIDQVLSLTYQTGFFAKLGFEVVEKHTLPHKIWKDCLYCKKYDHCDETAMVYYTQQPHAVYIGQVAEA